ncbi:MAG: ABC transporter C-terminal domain-containing protein, partial [Clostridiaceae bacterium]|nr:ABC transporter C-terminal domain-containing protein [Clostridiaceae bacterium]
IENTEAGISDIENMLSDVEIAADYNKTIELSAELQKLKDKDEELMVLWEELNEWLMENGEKEDV